MQLLLYLYMQLHRATTHGYTSFAVNTNSSFFNKLLVPIYKSGVIQILVLRNLYREIPIHSFMFFNVGRFVY